MTLPEVCPLDEFQTCKGRECHLFCLEWRTREPTCLIGYNTTSKVRSNKADRRKDTYAEDTFRKLGQQHQPRWKNVTEKGDWTPTRPVERPPERPVERREEKTYPAVEKDSQKLFFGRREERDTRPERSPEEDHEERIQKIKATSEAEKASMRLEARLKKEPVEEDSIIYASPQPKVEEKPKVQEKPKAQEKIISRDKHATIFAACDEEEEKKNIYSSEKEEKPGKPAENKNNKNNKDNKDRRKKFEEVMDISLPDNYEEEFWS